MKSKNNVSSVQLAMLESIPDSAMVIDEIGKIFYLNKNAEILFGYSASEILKTPVNKLIHEKFRTAHIQAIQLFIREPTKENSQFESHYAINKAGNEFPIQVSLGLLPTEFENMILVTYKDIGDRKKSEDELVRKNHLLNFAEEIVMMGHWQWNLVTNEVVWSENLYQIFGRDKKGGLTYDTYFGYVHPDDRDFVTERVETSIADKKFHHFHHRILLEDGQVKNIHLMGQIFTNDDADVIEMVGTCQDVTEKIKHDELLRSVSILEAKSKEMEQFAYIASHDLKHPLLTIINYIEAFNEDFGNELPEDAKMYLRSISQSAKRMDDLIIGLLEYARLSKKKDFETVDCNKLVETVLKDIHSTVKSAAVDIIVGKLPVVQGLEIELRQVFQNLILNAIKFRHSVRKPQIEIEAQQIEKNGGYLFAIRDNGIGFNEKDKENIFLIFKKLHDAEDYEGYGLGLANCKKIVELHFGQIWAESKLGEGSSFYFTINT